MRPAHGLPQPRRAAQARRRHLAEPPLIGPGRAVASHAPLRVGVVGIGFGRAAHVPAFRADPRCRVVALCASDPARARAAASALGIEHAFGDWRAIAEAPDIDALGIAVPPDLQPAIVERAARAGKHVFCEKPAACDAAQAARMLAVVRAAGVVHSIDFIFPEIEAWREARGYLERGRLGGVRSAALSWRVETAAYRTLRAGWKLAYERGGGTLANFGCHSLHYLEWLLGPVQRCAARLRPAGASADARVDAWLELAGGVPVTVSIAADAFAGSGHRLEISGEAGTLRLENPGPDYVDGFRCALWTRRGGPAGARARRARRAADGRIAAVARIARRFVDAIESGGSAQPNLEGGLRVQCLIDALRRADASGTWQSVADGRDG